MSGQSGATGFRMRYVGGILGGTEDMFYHEPPKRVDFETKFGEKCVCLADSRDWPDADGTYHVRLSPDTPSLA
jgi:hypothetical protein